MSSKGRDLRVRIKGNDVFLLQHQLLQLGLIIEDTEGYFGKSTRQAVKEFQTNHKTESTDVVDEKTANGK